MAENTRAQGRYGPDNHGPALSAFVQYESEPDRTPVELIDLSAGGAGFLCDGIPQSGKAIVLSLESGAGSDHWQFGAVIRWAEPVARGRWRVGCSFSSEVGDSLLTECQQPVRAACNQAVLVRRQSQNDRTEATIVDYSVGGFCVDGDMPVAPGETLLFQTPGCADSAYFVATVVWQRSVAGRSTFGCQFTQPSQRAAFRRSLGIEVAPVLIPEVPRTRRTADRSLWLACGFVYGFVALYSLGLWPPA